MRALWEQVLGGDCSPVLHGQRLGNNVFLHLTNAAFGPQFTPAVAGTFTDLPDATSSRTRRGARM